MDKVPASYANIGFSNPTKILRSTWCPDKDLLVVVVRAAGKDRLGLWNMAGAKKWEVDIETESTTGQEIVDIAWSPDGQYVAVASNPPLVTLHSLQDGHQERALSILSKSPGNSLVRIWWLKEYRIEKKASMPDIFKRGGDITGSAHTILKTQPLLDPLLEPQSLSATDLFGFKGGSGKSSAQKSTPDVISSWPTLPSDPLAASIQAQSSSGKENRPGEELDEVDDSNVNSVLAVSDDAGAIYGFLDGSYPFGAIELGEPSSVINLQKQRNATLFLYQQIRSSSSTHSALRPAIVHTPFLSDRSLRDLARASSSCRELTWYAMRVVKEMRDAWMGSPTNTGARELGPNWIRALEKKQKEKFGQKEPNALVDLSLLLTTRKSSEALGDFFGSGDLMSERSLQKWESNVTEALSKLRDYSSRRLAPACQRLHIILQEVYGWSQLPQYTSNEFQQDEIKTCMELAEQAVFCASWLASTARIELARFREFMLWLRFETTPSPTDTNAAPIPQKHDLLDVSDYLDSGLATSPIDQWFTGSHPTFKPSELPKPAVEGVRSAVAKARLSLKQGLKWPPTTHQVDHSNLQRNMDLLMQQLSTRCQKIFLNAANATSRNAAVVNSLGQLVRESGAGESSQSAFIREHTVDDTSKGNYFLQYLAIQTPRVDQSSYLFLVCMSHARDGTTLANSMSFVTLQCCIAPTNEGEHDIPIEVLDAEFFDDRVLILIYRPLDQEQGATSIASIGYADLVFEDAPADYVTCPTREVLMQSLLQNVKDGQIAAVPIPITGSRELVGCQEGTVSLAVNGRLGRRVACVLDSAGLALEVLDMEGEEEEEEVEDEEMETAAG